MTKTKSKKNLAAANSAEKESKTSTKRVRTKADRSTGDIKPYKHTPKKPMKEHSSASTKNIKGDRNKAFKRASGKPQQNLSFSSVFGAIRKQMGPSRVHNTAEKKRTHVVAKKAQHIKHRFERPKRAAFQIVGLSHTSTRTLEQVVWWKSSSARHPITITTKANKLPRISKKHDLPTDNLPDKMMTLLDHELDAFASYVRLRPIEVEAREHIIQHVTDMAGTLFGNKAQMQCFGSFATPSIATFASDVDLAMWGVVPFVNRSTTDRTANQRESRISKWRDALSELDQSQQDKEALAKANDTTKTPEKESPPNVDDDSKPAAASITGETSKRRKRSNSSSSLFLLDRNGALELGADEVEIESLIESTENNLFQLDHDGIEEEKKSDNETPFSVAEKSLIDLCSDSDDDSADKLESLSNPKTGEKAYVANTASDSDDTRSSCSSPDIFANNDGLEISFVSRALVQKGNELDDETRPVVVGSLRTLGKALWRSPFMSNVEVRHRAKVPIVTTDTKLGFEADVAVGGHNGTDTSQFASTQAEKYKSFGPVVLLLKILLAQQELDKPFTGGLGSFKLYVLVSHHIERHLSLGGMDRPSEVLLSFFGRFGNAQNTPGHQDSFTWLGQEAPDVTCQDGSADLKPVFKIDHCVDLFGLAWELLVETMKRGDTSRSMLADVVDEHRLRLERERRLRQASTLSDFTKPKNKSVSCRDPNKSSGDQRIVNHVFARTEAVQPPLEASEDVLLAGYGVKRGPRGSLIPKFQPAHGTSQNTLFGRATKNRHSKKKQSRDVALKEFASRHVR